MSLESMQNEVIREILNTDSMLVLKKVKKILHGSELKIDEKESYAKEDIVKGLTEACKDIKLSRNGKLKGRPIEELLNEL